MTPRERAASVARDLADPRLLSAEPVDAGERIIFIFDLIPHETLPWTKGVEVETATASRDSVLLVFNDWKKKVRNDIMMNRPSPTLQRAIQVHGLPAVKKVISA